MVGSGIAIDIGLKFSYMSQDTAQGLALGTLSFVEIDVAWMWWRYRSMHS